MKLFYLLNLHFLIRRPLQSLLCLAGVMIGVAVIVGVDAANSNALSSFRSSVDTIAGRATHVVVSRTNSNLDETALGPLLAQTTIPAAPIIEEQVSIQNAGGEILQILGVDPLMEGPFRPSGLADNVRSTSISQLMVVPASVAISRQFADRHSFKIGDHLEFVAGTTRRTLQIISILQNDSLQSASENVAFTDISTAQEIFNMRGKLSRVDLICSDSQLAQVKSQLPANAIIERSTARTARIEQMIGSFQMNLFALSLLAIFVGAFLIYNTLTFSVIQRRRQIGILRCIGMSRVQIGILFLSEGLLLGFLGTVAGIILGTLLTGYTNRAISGTITSLYAAIALPPMHVGGSTVLKAFAIGMLGSLVSAVVPMAEAVSIRPGGAISRSVIDNRIRRASPRLAYIGLGLMTISAALAFYPSHRTLPGYLSAFSMILGFGFICPVCTLALVSLIIRMVRRLTGPITLIGVRNISASLSRTATAIAALMVALAMLIGVNLMVRSFRESVIQWIEQTLRADLYIQPAGRRAQGENAFLPPDFIAALRSDPRIEQVDLLRQRRFVVRGSEITVSAVSLAVLSRRSNYQFVGGTPKDAFAGAIHGDAAIISETLSSRMGYSVGDAIELPTPNGVARFAVAGIYRDYSADGGQALIDRSAYLRYWKDSSVNNAAVYLRSGENAEMVARDLRSKLSEKFAFLMRSNADLRREIIKIFDNTFAITYVLQFLSMVVAVCGVLSALLLLLLERTSELATLRAIGLTLRQLQRMLFIEAGAIGLIASVIGSVAGLCLSVLLVYVINVRSFGWTIQFHVFPGVFIVATILSIAAALAATLYPAFRLKGMPLSSAMREE